MFLIFFLKTFFLGKLAGIYFHNWIFVLKVPIRIKGLPIDFLLGFFYPKNI